MTTKIKKYTSSTFSNIIPSGEILNYGKVFSFNAYTYRKRQQLK
jgi:hypothetical protein